MILILKNKLFTLHDKMTVKNENDELMYTIESKALSMADKTYVYNSNDEEVAFIHRKPISIHERYFVEMTDGTNFEMESELFHVAKDIINIDDLGWRIQGNIMEHDYQIVSDRGSTIASTHRKWGTLHDVFVIDVQDEENADKVVALYVALEHILHTRAAIRNEK